MSTNNEEKIIAPLIQYPIPFRSVIVILHIEFISNVIFG